MSWPDVSTESHGALGGCNLLDWDAAPRLKRRACRQQGEPKEWQKDSGRISGARRRITAGIVPASPMPSSTVSRPTASSGRASVCSISAREPARWQIGRAHGGTPVTNAHLVFRLLLE